MSRAFKLYRLQQVDSQLDQGAARLAEIERILGDNQAHQAASEAQQRAQAALHTAHTAMRSAEENVSAQQKRIEQNQASLYGGAVTNPKELQDLQMESESLARRLSELEDTQLEAMSAYELQQAAAQAADAALAEVEAQLASEHQALFAEKAELLAEQTRLQGEHETALSGVEPADLEVYSGLRASKAGIAVSKVEAGTCSACGAEPSAARAQAARSGEELTRCDNCKRILYS
ncbi:MAG: hypothetical protein KIS88_01965 [Anaerolineales bacterium]|nr:hypothetical protein [Anaerolineales bacterium]